MAAGKRQIGAEQCLLDRLLGVGAPDELRAMVKKDAAVASHQRLERLFVPLSDQLGQLLVAQALQQLWPGGATMGEQTGIHDSCGSGGGRNQRRG
jgi:hypothetical protein